MLMNEFEIFMTIMLSLLLLYNSLKDGGKTSHRDEEVDDYWSDG